MPTENRALQDRPARLAWILPAIWQIAPPPESFCLTPEQHRRQAQDLRDVGRPDLAHNHEICALIIERRRRRMH
jgi:propanediol dehydratase small subunit